MMYEQFNKDTASVKDRIAWALCQIIDDDAPIRWTRYRFVAECIARNPKVMNDLRELAGGAAPKGGVVDEDMTDRAIDAWDDTYDGVSHNKREAMRAALTAALGRQTEELEPIQPEAPEDIRAMLVWAVERWHDEVANRPLVNRHRRSLDDVWRQVIRKLGADDVVLIGPRHDALVALGNQEAQS